MFRPLKTFLLFALLGAVLPAFAAETAATLYKNPNCGCCDAYAEYLRDNGFAVKVIETAELPKLRAKSGVPEGMAGCHTTHIDGYVFEGHIPAESIARVLREKPEIKGLSVPGMPPGSPGMTGTKQGPLNVYSFSDAAPARLYEAH